MAAGQSAERIGPGSTPTRPAAGRVLESSSGSDSDSDSVMDADEDDSDHPDNPCRETLLPYYECICTVERGSRAAKAPDLQPGSTAKSTLAAELRVALRSHVAQVSAGCNTCLVVHQEHVHN